MSETTITLSHDTGLQRGDFVTLSGLVNNPFLNGKPLVVRRAKGTMCLVEPAGWWDYVTYYAKMFWNEAQWNLGDF